jgi:hypothetical protein
MGVVNTLPEVAATVMIEVLSVTERRNALPSPDRRGLG